MIKPVPEGIMSYNEEDLNHLDKYLQHSHGATVSLYEKKDDSTPIYTGTVNDLCELPECQQLLQAGYIIYSAYISFAKTGHQRIKINGAKIFTDQSGIQ